MQRRLVNSERTHNLIYDRRSYKETSNFVDKNKGQKIIGRKKINKSKKNLN